MSNKRINNKDYLNLNETCNQVINEVVGGDGGDGGDGGQDPNVPHTFSWDDMIRLVMLDPGNMDDILDIVGPETAPPPVGWFHRWKKYWQRQNNQ